MCSFQQGQQLIKCHSCHSTFDNKTTDFKNHQCFIEPPAPKKQYIKCSVPQCAEPFEDNESFKHHVYLYHEMSGDVKSLDLQGALLYLTTPNFRWGWAHNFFCHKPYLEPLEA